MLQGLYHNRVQYLAIQEAQPRIYLVEWYKCLTNGNKKTLQVGISSSSIPLYNVVKLED